jgi:hypothetical protein
VTAVFLIVDHQENRSGQPVSISPASEAPTRSQAW